LAGKGAARFRLGIQKKNLDASAVAAGLMQFRATRLRDGKRYPEGYCSRARRLGVDFRSTEM